MASSMGMTPDSNRTLQCERQDSLSPAADCVPGLIY